MPPRSSCFRGAPGRDARAPHPEVGGRGYGGGVTASDPRPLRILHLSDTHLFGDDSLHYDLVDTRAALDRVLARAAELDTIDLVVVSGDLSQDGSEESYRRLRSAVAAWADARSAAVAYAMGNHDDPRAFESVLGPREVELPVRGWRVITFDSSVPGAGYGLIDADQRRWLHERLAEPCENGTVLVVHHPPVPAAGALLKELQLQQPADLLTLAAASDVRVILSGHYHHPLVQQAAGIPVVVAPGITNTSDAIAPAGRERATVGSGFGVVEVPAACDVRVTFVTAPSPEDGTVIFDLDEGQVAAIAREAGPPQPE